MTENLELLSALSSCTVELRLDEELLLQVYPVPEGYMETEEIFGQNVTTWGEVVSVDRCGDEIYLWFNHNKFTFTVKEAKTLAAAIRRVSNAE